MGLNPFDEQLEQLGPAPNPFDRFVSDAQGDRERRLRQTVREADKTTPDTRAESLNLSERTGLPVDVIERNLEDARRKAKLEAVPYSQILEQTPNLAEWLGENEHHAAVAADDMEQLGLLEWLTKAPQRSFQQGIEQDRVGRLRQKELLGGTLTPEERDQLNASKFYMTHGGALGAGDSWFRNAVTGGSQLLVNIGAGSFEALKYGAVGAAEVGAIGAAGGAITGPGAVAGGIGGAALGFRAGAIYGAAKYGFTLEGGLAFDEFLEFAPDATGQPIDRDTARAAALAVGALNSGLEVVGLGILAKSIPGVDKLTGLAAKNAVKQALRVPTIRAALADAVRSYGATLTGETATEVAQRAITIMGGELAKVASGQTGTGRTGEEIATELGQEAVGAIQAFGLTAAAGPTIRAAGARKAAQDASASAQLFQAIGEGVAASKTFQRAPKAVERLIEKAAEAGPTPAVYAPADTWVEYWQSKGADPAAMAAEVTGDAQALDHALATGSDLRIPTARYAVTIAPTEHNAFFANELRLSPESMNGREEQAFKEAQAQQTAQQQQAEAQAAPTPIEEIRQQLTTQLVEEGGFRREDAESYARLVERINVMAQDAGLDPRDVLRGYGLEVRRAPVGEAGLTPSAEPAPSAASPGAPVQAALPAEGTAPAGALRPEYQPFAQFLAERPELNVATQGPRAMLSAYIEKTWGLFGQGDMIDAVLRSTARGAKTKGDQKVAILRWIQKAEADYLAQMGEPLRRPPGAATLAPDATSTEAIVEPAAEAGAGAAAGAEAGPRPVDVGVEQPRADEERGDEGAGDGARPERRRLPSPDEYPLEPFQRADPAVDATRLTPEVTRELSRILDELEQFPYIEKTWHWIDDSDTAWGNAAGGQAQITGGAAGAPVYDDIRSWAPLNRGKGGELAKAVHGSRADVAAAIQKILETNTIPTNLAEGAVRVAERRAADDYRYISRALLPPTWGTEAPVELVDALSAAIDDAQAEGDVALEEGAPEGDVSFDPSEFGQTLFDDLREGLEGDTVDTLETGEQQPRLPGDVGAVREQNIATPELEAPFSLTSPADKSKRGKQTTLFQPAAFQQRLAAALERADNTADSRKVPFPQVPVEFGSTLFRAADRKAAHVVEVPIEDLVSTQPTVSEDIVAKKTGAEAAPVALEHDGRYYLADGTHRAVAAWARGETTFKVEAWPVRPDLLEQPPVYRSALEADTRTFYQPAFHGSPHRFEQFSLQHIGTGEGAASYGWGLYFASQREVADRYRERLAGDQTPGMTFDGTSVFDREIGLYYVQWEKLPPSTTTGQESRAVWVPTTKPQDQDVQRGLLELSPRLHYSNVAKTREMLGMAIENREAMIPRGETFSGDVERDKYDLQSDKLALKVLDTFGDEFFAYDRSKPGRTYTVDIPSDDVMLDWDKPASQQPDLVKQALTALGIDWQAFQPKTAPALLRWFQGPTAARLASEDIGIRESINEGYKLTIEALDSDRPEAQSALRRWQEQHQGYFAKGTIDPTGDNLYGEIKRAAEEKHRELVFAGQAGSRKVYTPPSFQDVARMASELLREHGVVGIKYLDGMSRAAGEGSHNYVIFDDSLVAITEYDQPFFHGSPFDFTKFSTEKIGTGEGAAAYGWGLYFAENPDVAATYFDQLSGDPQIQRIRLGSMFLSERNQWDYSRRASESTLENIRASLAEDVLVDPLGALGAGTGGFQRWVLEMLDRRIEAYKSEWPEGVGPAQQLRRELARPGAVSIAWDKKTGGVYTVEVDDSHIERMLDLDKPLKDQTDTVKQIARELLKEEGFLGADDNGPRQLLSAWKSFQIERGGMLEGDTGHTLYEALVRRERRKAGIEALERRREELRATHQEAIERLGPGGDVVTDREGVDERKRLTDEIDRIHGSASQRASLFLLSRGVPGNIYLDQGSRERKRGTRNVVAFTDGIVKITHKDGTPLTAAEREEYFQARGGPRPKRRGSITIGPGRKMTINLFADADLSTFLHESGHFFLEVFSDLADQVRAIPEQQRTAGQRRLLNNYQAALAALKVTKRSEIGMAQHEAWARMFEQYLMEGKAPSEELRTVFSRFRAWLLGIYRLLENLGAPLTPQVREVFDRMLATDEEIAAAQARARMVPLFVTAEQAGMTPDRFALYRETLERAHRKAVEELDAKLHAEVRREQTAQWKARREEVYAEVATEVHARPVYQALSAIRRGTKPDGSPLVEGMTPEPMRLSKRLIVERFGAGRLQALPKFTYVREDGVDPAVVAELFGFDSDDALLQAIAGAPAMAKAINDEVDARMIREHGSILLDGGAAEAAEEAVANEERELVLREELRALARLRRTVTPFEQLARAEGEAAGRAAEQPARERAEAQVRAMRSLRRHGAAAIAAAVPSHHAIRDAAVDRVAKTKVRYLSPATYWAAMRRASDAAVQAAARQDFEEAIRQKTLELVNLYMFREAEKAKTEIEQRALEARQLVTPKAQQRLGKAGGGWREQVNGILERYEFARIPIKQLERRAALKDWLEAQEAEGLPVDHLPAEVLDDARRINYKELTVEEVRGVTDGLKMLLHLARLKNRLLAAKDARDFEKRRDAVVQSIHQHNTRKPLPLEFSAKDDTVRSWRAWFASLARSATLARILDGDRDGGEFWNAFQRPLNEAADHKETRMRAAFEGYRAIIDRHYPQLDIRRWKQKAAIAGVGSLTLEARIAVALNAGNATSRDRLLSDPTRKWTQGHIDAILASLDQNDLDFVEATWAYIDQFWPEIADKQERVTGIRPEKVEASPITINGRTLKGGYYPLVYDGRLSARAKQNEEANQAKLATAAAYIRTTTRRGHVEQRKKNVHLSIKLDLDVAFGHMEQVIHDLAFHEALLDVNRILRDSAVTRAIYETRGEHVHEQLTRTVQDIANGRLASGRQNDKAATFARTGVQISGLGWNVWTALQQPLGVFNGMERVGAKWVAKGMLRWLRDTATMESTVHWIQARSEFMRERHRTGTQDLSDLRQQLRTPGGWFDLLVRRATFNTLTQQTILDGYMWHIGMAQRVADVPTWLGQYEKARAAGVSDEEAVAQADQAVIDSQGSGRLSDLSEAQRGTPIARLFLTFYTYGATTLNRSYATAQTKSPAQVLTILNHVSLTYVMPAIATVLLANAVGRRDDEEAEDWLLGVAGESIGAALNGLPWVRELAASGRALVESDTTVRGYEGPAGARVFELVSRLAQQVEQGEADEALWKAANQVGGILLRYPAGQVERTVEGYRALVEGETKNPLAIAVAQQR